MTDKPDSTDRYPRLADIPSNAESVPDAPAPEIEEGRERARYLVRVVLADPNASSEEDTVGYLTAEGGLAAQTEGAMVFDNEWAAAAARKNAEGTFAATGMRVLSARVVRDERTA